MKGITSIIAIILLLLIVIAITGFAFVFFLQVTESSDSSARQQLETQTNAIESSFIIESVSQNHVYVRNTGSNPLADLGLYVNNIPVDFTGPSSLNTNEIGVYDIDNNDLVAISNPSIVKVTSLGWEQQISIALTPSTPPVISAINVSSTLESATVTWTTDRSSTSLVKYGTSPGSYTNTQTGADGTSHSATLTGLSILTTYYFVVNSTDTYGNTAESSEMNFTTLGSILFVSPTPASGQSVSSPLTINISLNPHVDADNITLRINNFHYSLPNLLSCNFNSVSGSMINCDNGKNGTMPLPNMKPGRFGQGIRLDNPGETNPLTFPSDGNLNTAEGTVMFWIKTNLSYISTNGLRRMLIDTTNNTNATRRSGFNLSAREDFITLCLSTEAQAAANCTARQIRYIADGFLDNYNYPNSWSFIALSYNSANNRTNLTVYYGNQFFDYIFAEQSVTLAGSIQAFNSNVYLGSNFTGGMQANGTFDSFKIYSRRLTGLEINNILANETAFPGAHVNVSNREYGSYYLKLNLSAGTYTIRAFANRTNDSTTLRSETRTFTVV